MSLHRNLKFRAAIRSLPVTITQLACRIVDRLPLVLPMGEGWGGGTCIDGSIVEVANGRFAR